MTPYRLVCEYGVFTNNNNNNNNNNNERNLSDSYGADSYGVYVDLVLILRH